MVTRRFQTKDRSGLKTPATFGEQTAGLIQVIETAADSSAALVVYACGELVAGAKKSHTRAGSPCTSSPTRTWSGTRGRELPPENMRPPSGVWRLAQDTGLILPATDQAVSVPKGASRS